MPGDDRNRAPVNLSRSRCAAQDAPTLRAQFRGRSHTDLRRRHGRGQRVRVHDPLHYPRIGMHRRPGHSSNTDQAEAHATRARAKSTVATASSTAAAASGQNPNPSASCTALYRSTQPWSFHGKSCEVTSSALFRVRFHLCHWGFGHRVHQRGG
jgi:hypothetical protein